MSKLRSWTNRIALMVQAGGLGRLTDRLDEDLPAKSSQIGTPWPTREDSNPRL